MTNDPDQFSEHLDRMMLGINFDILELGMGCLEPNPSTRSLACARGNIDISKVYEDNNNVNLALELACAGGVCEINF